MPSKTINCKRCGNELGTIDEDGMGINPTGLKILIGPRLVCKHCGKDYFFYASTKKLKALIELMGKTCTEEDLEKQPDSEKTISI